MTRDSNPSSRMNAQFVPKYTDIYHDVIRGKINKKFS